MFNWQVVESYQGVYTFKNVGQNKYLYTNNGLTYENTNIVLADKSAIASHKVDPFAFRLAYDTESMGYCIFPIASSNGTYRKITVNKTASSGSYSVKMKLASESVYSTFDLEAVTYSGELLQCAFTVKDAPTLALTGTPTVVTAPTSENGNVTTTDVVAQTYSETNANQQWILEPYMHTVHSNTTYTDAEKYYSSLDFRSPFDSNNPIVVTSDFGNRYRNSKVQTHEGVDMRARSPIDLYAPSSGRVAFVRSTVASTAGLYIVIETDYYAFDSTQKIYIVYMHMDSISVSVGDRVDQLSKVGQSGNTTTSDEKNYHLHCGIFVAQAGLTNFYSLTHQTSLWNITPINPLHFYEPESYVMSTSANDPLLRYIPTHS